MTLRTSTAVKCECGEIGSILLAENDQPYSAPVERYSLRGLKGTEINLDRFADWPEVFEKMGVRCAMCNKRLTPENIVSGRQR